VADANIPAQVLTFKYRLLPKKRQHAALARILESQRQLYNAALEERINCYRKTGKSLSYIDQCKALTELRKDSDFSNVPTNLQRGTLKRLDEAFEGFFSRLKRGDKPGFPRFRGKSWFASFEFAEWSGARFDGNRVRFKGMPGGLRVHMHRPLPAAKILSAKFKRDAKGWSVCLVARVPCEATKQGGRSVGLDMGIKALATGNDGLIIPNPHSARRAERDMRRRQRALARCKRGSNGRKKVKARLARVHAKIANCRSTYLHQQSSMLVRNYDRIAIEDLNIKGLARGMLARDVNDASWGRLIQLLDYKAAKAGVELIKVNPRNTSQACSGCGVIVPKTLAVRTHNCPDCGLSLCRDENAARNILSKAVLGLEVDNVAQWSVRRPGNITSGVSM
jgi:putative transposase